MSNLVKIGDGFVNITYITAIAPEDGGSRSGIKVSLSGGGYRHAYYASKEKRDETLARLVAIVGGES